MKFPTLDWIIRSLTLAWSPTIPARRASPPRGTGREEEATLAEPQRPMATTIPSTTTGITTFLSMVALLSAAACLEDHPAEPPVAPGFDDTPLQEELGEDPHMVTLARDIPGFAGFSSPAQIVS